MVSGSMGHRHVQSIDHPSSEGVPMWSSPLWSSGIDIAESSNPLYGAVRELVGYGDQRGSDRPF